MSTKASTQTVGEFVSAPLQRSEAPFVSIVTPCLNEELVVGEFVDWCREGLARAGVDGEIVIVDSSSDRSAEIAASHGARVLSFPKRGLGQAYIDAIPHLRGDYVIMGDCDLTYDFREIQPFVEKLDEGYDLVMGSRFRGSIEAGAMPRLHQHFGTPITTWILNRLYRTRYSDIHCGMRAVSRESLERIDLESSSWEYASEMILKAAKLGLRTAEVPVRFYKDRDGRVSHHKRAGWLSPWRAGWQNLRMMFLYAPGFFLVWPGFVMLFAGLALSLMLSAGQLNIGSVGLDLHWMLLGVTLATLGYTCLQLAVLAKVHANFEPRFRERVLKLATFDRCAIVAALAITIGVGLNALLVYHWSTQGFRLSDIYHPAVLGLLLIILGFQTFVFALLLHLTARSSPKQEGE